MMDYAGPLAFPPTEQRLGVGEHPHRGFETVTIVYHGEVEHRDSGGGGGKIGPGEVQWMTAASGVVHEEFHGSEFAKTGGLFEMVQLWVNLPKKHKMSKPRYQSLSREQIPEVQISGDAGIIRVIAGTFQGHAGPASTFTPMQLWDARLKKNHHYHFQFPENHTVTIFVLNGEIFTSDGYAIKEAELAVLENEGSEFSFETKSESKVLVMSGEPLNEPIAAYGPFVMNTKEEIRQAIDDFHAGKMGKI